MGFRPELDDYDATSGSLNFYESPVSWLSQELTGSGTFRNGQEVRVKGGTSLGSLGTWAFHNVNNPGDVLDVDDMDDFLRFTITDYNSVFGGATDFGLHWAMTCGNDTFEGGFSTVPEPSPVMLLGLGLLGIAEYTRRSKRRK